MPLEDDVEIYIDADHNRNQIRDSADKSFLIAAGGLITKRTVNFDGKSYESQIESIYSGKIHVNGTLNDDSDTDLFYVIEFAISWEILGVKPGKTSSMGLEIWNNDKDYINGNYFYAGWTTKASVLNNTSEWGNVYFIRSNNMLYISIVILIITIGGATFFLLKKKLHKKPDTDSAFHVEKEYIRKAKIYTEEHYDNDTLSREELARFIGLTPSYFGQLFKKETCINFKDYLTAIRIEKAKNLLLTTDSTISEIAYEIGFGSQSYFGKKFEEIENISPNEFRHRHEKNK